MQLPISLPHGLQVLAVVVEERFVRRALQIAARKQLDEALAVIDPIPRHRRRDDL